MTKFFKTISCAIALAAIVSMFYLSRDNVSWDYLSKVTGVRVPLQCKISKVNHPTEVSYRGHIYLHSTSNIKDFIALNGLTQIKLHLESDGLIHKGTIVYDVPKEKYSETYVLFGGNDSYSWEFVLDSNSGHVMYEVLVPDMSGDLPVAYPNP